MLTLFLITLSIAGLAAGGAGLIASAVNSTESAQFLLDAE